MNSIGLAAVVLSVVAFATTRKLLLQRSVSAVVGVRLGGIGHFIAVLDCHDGQVTYADPLHGEGHLSLAELQRRYDFTGFHMVIQRS